MAGIILAGNEAASFEKLTAALRLAKEAATARRRMDIIKALDMATEAGTELGVFLSDGRWAQVLVGMELARKQVVALQHMHILAVGDALEDAFEEMHRMVVLLRHGRVRH